MLDWLIVESLDPWGEMRADLRAGIVAAAAAAPHTKKALRPTDFMPFYKVPEQTPDEQFAILGRVLGG